MNDELTTISISEKRVVKKLMLPQRDGSEREMAKILLPDSGTILRPAEQIRKGREEGKVIFSLPKDYEVTVAYRNEGVPDDAPQIEKYRYEKMSPEELKNLINPNKDRKRDENLLSITIEKRRLYGEIDIDGKSFTRIGTPDNRTFLRPTEQIHESRYDKDRVYFSLPKTMPAKEDKEEGPYQITLSKPILDENGNSTGDYENTPVTSEELKQLYDDYYERQRERMKEAEQKLARIHIRPENILSENPEEKKALIKLPTPQGVDIVFEVHQDKLKRGQKGNGYELVFNADTKINVAMEMKKKDGSLGTTEPSDWLAKDLEEAVSGKSPEPEAKQEEKKEEERDTASKTQRKKSRSGTKR